MTNKQHNNDLEYWELIIDEDEDTDKNKVIDEVPFSNYIYKVIACRHLYKHMLKPVNTLYEFINKTKLPYKKSPLSNFVSIKYNIDTISNDFKKIKKEVIVDGWVML